MVCVEESVSGGHRCLVPDLSQLFAEYRVIVITGGSSGIGRAFVERIQHLNDRCRFCNLSRSKPARFMRDEQIFHKSLDLADPNACDKAVEWLRGQLEEVSDGKILLINNAGFGSYGRFPDPNLDHQLEMISLNAAAPVHITGRLLPFLKERGGAVINICSTAAFQPTPYMSVYGASKVFLLHWSLALHQELRREGVQVLAVCPGPTESNFFRRAGFSEKPLQGRLRGQTAEAVVEESLRALLKERAMVVSGFRNRLLVGASGLLPKPVQARASEFVLRKLRLERHMKAAK